MTMRHCYLSVEFVSGSGAKLVTNFFFQQFLIHLNQKIRGKNLETLYSRRNNHRLYNSIMEIAWGIIGSC